MHSRSNTIYIVLKCVGVYVFWSFFDIFELNGAWCPVGAVKGIYTPYVYNTGIQVCVEARAALST